MLGLSTNCRQLKFVAQFLTGSNRKQIVVLPGITSDWVYILAGVPQGSVIGHLIFFLCFKDIVNDICAYIRLFTHGTTLSIVVENPVIDADLI